MPSGQLGSGETPLSGHPPSGPSSQHSSRCHRCHRCYPSSILRDYGKLLDQAAKTRALAQGDHQAVRSDSNSTTLSEESNESQYDSEHFMQLRNTDPVRLSLGVEAFRLIDQSMSHMEHLHSIMQMACEYLNGALRRERKFEIQEAKDIDSRMQDAIPSTLHTLSGPCYYCSRWPRTVPAPEFAPQSEHAGPTTQAQQHFAPIPLHPSNQRNGINMFQLAPEALVTSHPASERSSPLNSSDMESYSSDRSAQSSVHTASDVQERLSVYAHISNSNEPVRSFESNSMQCDNQRPEANVSGAPNQDSSNGGQHQTHELDSHMIDAFGPSNQTRGREQQESNDPSTRTADLPLRGQKRRRSL